MELTKDQEKMLDDLVPNIVSREEWKAETPTRRRKLKLPVEKVVFVHSKSNPCYSKEECMYAVQKLQKYQMHHLDKSDVEPNFLIGRDGTVLEGRGWNYTTSKIDGEDPNELSGKSLEIAFIDHEEMKPTKYQLKAALGLLVTGIKNKFIAEKVAVYQFEFEDPIFSPPENEKTEEDDLKEMQESWDELDEEEKEKHRRLNDEIGKMKIEDF